MKYIMQIIRWGLVASVLFLLPIAVSAEEITAKNADGKNINYNTISKEEVEVSERSDYVGDLRVPLTVKDKYGKEYKITAVGNYAFSGCTDLTSVELPDAVTSIGYSAFDGCEKLISVNIPTSLTYVGDKAFMYCTNMVGTFTLPKTVTYIGKQAFYRCEKLTGDFVMPASLKTWDTDFSFGYCLAMKSVKIHDDAVSIGSKAFYNCFGLESITVGKKVASIGKEAFINVEAKGLKDIYCYPENPPSASDKIFSNNITSTATLYVPIGSKVKYQAADYWKDFKNIVETNFVGIENAEMDKDAVNVSISGSSLNISGAEDATLVQIYSTSGALLNSTTVGSAQGISLPHGVYIVKVGGKSYKVAY